MDHGEGNTCHNLAKYIYSENDAPVYFFWRGKILGNQESEANIFIASHTFPIPKDSCVTPNQQPLHSLDVEALDQQITHSSANTTYYFTPLCLHTYLSSFWNILPLPPPKYLLFFKFQFRHLILWPFPPFWPLCPLWHPDTLLYIHCGKRLTKLHLFISIPAFLIKLGAPWHQGQWCFPAPGPEERPRHLLDWENRTGVFTVLTRLEGWWERNIQQIFVEHILCFRH